MSHWALDYIGLPYEAVPSGKGHNCWSLVCDIQQNHFNITMPFFDRFAGDNTFSVLKLIRKIKPEQYGWDKAEIPQNGDITFLGQGLKPHHIGVYIDIDGGGILHSLEGSGVIFSRLTDIQFRIAWNFIEFYRYSK